MVRHGITDHNAGLRLTGWGDPDLNEAGLQQAEEAAERLVSQYQFEGLYVSPLRRAVQTAQPFSRLSGLEPVYIADLKELNFGEAEGRSIAEMKDLYPEMFAAWREHGNPDFSWPGGEKRSVFHGRVDRAIWEIIRAEVEKKHQTTAIVGHGAALAGFVTEILTGNAFGWREFLLDNCQHYHVRVTYDPAQPIEKQTVQMEVVSMGRRLELLPGN